MEKEDNNSRIPLPKDFFKQFKNKEEFQFFFNDLFKQGVEEICVIRADGSDFRMLTDDQYEDATPGWMPVRKHN